MRICHFTSAHDTHDVRVFEKECVSLAARYDKVYLVGRGESRTERGVEVVGVGQPAGGRLARMTGFAKKVYRAALALDCDIYHFHDPELLPYGVRLAKKGKRVIFDSHEFYAQQIANKGYIPRLLRPLAARIYKAYETHCIKRFDAVVVPCTLDGENVFEGRAKHTVFITNASVLGELYNTYTENGEECTKNVAYVGTLSGSRGVTNAILATHKAGGVLYLAGKFSSKEYEAQLRAMPEFSCVKYLGVLGRAGVRELLSQCRIGLFNMRDAGQYLHIDTMGVKVYEYLSMGLCVILPDTKYYNGLTDAHAFGVCVDCENVDAIAQAIGTYIANPALAREHGKNGRKAVLEYFNWGIEEKKLFALYDGLGGERK